MGATKTYVTGVRTISIPVSDQDKALDFYVETLGFGKLRDNPTPKGGRWIELSPGGDNVILTLEPALARGAAEVRLQGPRRECLLRQ